MYYSNAKKILFLTGVEYPDILEMSKEKECIRIGNTTSNTTEERIVISLIEIKK